MTELPVTVSREDKNPFEPEYDPTFDAEVSLDELMHNMAEARTVAYRTRGLLQTLLSPLTYIISGIINSFPERHNPYDIYTDLYPFYRLDSDPLDEYILNLTVTKLITDRRIA